MTFYDRENGYEIDSDGVEEILGELIFLNTGRRTANLMRRLDLPTPLFPIKRIFMLRSLRYLTIITIRCPWAYFKPVIIIIGEGILKYIQ